MKRADLQKSISCGEDSRHQFKRNATNADGLAAELAAFANSGGGWLFLGVNDDGSIAGLDGAAVRRLNQLVSNAASHNVRPPVHPLTENVQTDQGIVMVVEVPDGLAKPYLDNQGRIWVKQGSDKRHVTSREEMQRMFQRSGLVYADVVPAAGTSVEDIDDKTFANYFNRRYGESSEYAGLTREQLLQNLGLGDGRELNLAGLVLFGRNPQRWRPAFEVKAVAFPGTALHDTRYLDSEDIKGTLLEQFRDAFAFIKRNLHHVQHGRGFNTLGELEIPETALEELLVKQQAEAEGPRKPEQDTSYLARENYARARLLIDRGRYSDAVVSLENAIKLDGRQAVYHLELGQLLPGEADDFLRDSRPKPAISVPRTEPLRGRVATSFTTVVRC